MATERKTEFDHDNEGTPVGVSVHTSDLVYDRNGRAAEHTVVQYLAHALQQAGRNYEIDFNFPIQEPDLEETKRLGKQELYDWWRSQVNGDPEFEPRKDSNLLLTDREGGGLGAIGGWVAITPARNISEYARHEWTGTGEDGQVRNTYATLHECSHNLGMQHNPHWGNGWNDGGKWHRTITVSANGVKNLCGEWVEKRQHDREVRYLFYHDCALEHFEISDDDPLGPVADEPQLPDPPHVPPELPDPPTEPPESTPDETPDSPADETPGATPGDPPENRPGRESLFDRIWRALVGEKSR